MFNFGFWRLTYYEPARASAVMVGAGADVNRMPAAFDSEIGSK